MNKRLRSKIEELTLSMETVLATTLNAEETSHPIAQANGNDIDPDLKKKNQKILEL